MTTVTIDPRLERFHHYVNDMEWFASPCPKCHAPAAYLIDVAKSHFAVCPVDRVAWDAGYNVLTTYMRWADADLIEYFGTADRDLLTTTAIGLLAGYEVHKGDQVLTMLERQA